MAGKIKVNEVVLGDHVSPLNNFLLRTNQDGTASLLRGADGSGGEILGIDTTVSVNKPLHASAIDNTPIGQTNPQAGAFTTLSATTGFDLGRRGKM